MERDEIKNHLNVVFNRLESHLGDHFKKSYFAGGCIVSLTLNEAPKDYDVWFEDPADFEAADRKAISAKRTPFATTIQLPSGENIQLVKSRIGEPEKVVKTFDYLHTHAFFTRAGELAYDEQFIRSKVLKFVEGNWDHPVNTWQRMNKFVKRGYIVPQPTILALMKQTNAMKPESIVPDNGDHGGSR